MADNAPIEHMIVDPLGYAVMAYTATSMTKRLSKIWKSF